MRKKLYQIDVFLSREKIFPLPIESSTFLRSSEKKNCFVGSKIENDLEGVNLKEIMGLQNKNK